MIRLTLFNGSPLLVGKSLLENSVITVTDDGKYSCIIMKNDLSFVVDKDNKRIEGETTVLARGEHQVKETIDQIYEMLKT